MFDKRVYVLLLKWSLLFISFYLLFFLVGFELFYLIVMKFFSFLIVFLLILEIFCKFFIFWNDLFFFLNWMIFCVLIDLILGICWSFEGLVVLIFIFEGLVFVVDCFFLGDVDWLRCFGGFLFIVGIYRICWFFIFVEKLIWLLFVFFNNFFVCFSIL